MKKKKKKRRRLKLAVQNPPCTCSNKNPIMYVLITMLITIRTMLHGPNFGPVPKFSPWGLILTIICSGKAGWVSIRPNLSRL